MNQTKSSARAIAFYLPQFHPTPENDVWWGPGFTEWTNLARARPLFRGHKQPLIPGELGFYDLRLPETRAAQAELARAHGVEAFCYWHYWFGGGKCILHRPFDEVLASGEPDFPFCLGWANHSWSGVWDGAPNRILVQQTYPGEADDRLHFDHVRRAFEDPRFVRVDGKPLFYVFRPADLPEPRAFVDRWQRMAREAGLGGLFLVAEISDLVGLGAKCPPPAEIGFDAGVYVRLPIAPTPFERKLERQRRRWLRWPEAYEYARDWQPPTGAYDRDDVFPCVYPNWDNTPRSGRRGLVVRGSHPDRFARHVEQALAVLQTRPADRRLLFIKSWNEWAEGNHLEPDREHGRGYLEVLRHGLTATADRASRLAPQAVSA